MSKVQNKKSKFRATSTWKKFRQQMKQNNKVDFITKKPLYKGWNLHHLDLDEDHYTDLDPINFCCLNKQTHEFVHWAFRYDWREVLSNLEMVLLKIEELNEPRKISKSSKSIS